MNRIMLKSKIHGATLTDKDLAYEGSITIDEDLLELADMLPGEQCHVLNLDNGNRMETYTIAGPRGSKCFTLNGPAARLGEIGDVVFVLTYASYTDEEAKNHEPKVVLMDKNNNPKNL